MALSFPVTDMSLYSHALLVLIAWLFVCGYLLVNSMKIRYLRKVPSQPTAAPPSICLIVPARNEEKYLQQALESLAQLDYPNYQVMVVNDRSTDQTQAIIDNIKSRYPIVNCLQVHHLPEGWLGKSHAQQSGGTY
jgi:cellulose synthase/poly-beta-1,6-N-acetylglucosamine synthase-like glycosyltransferase